MGEPTGLPSMGSHRVGHDCSDLAAAAAATFHYIYLPQLTYPFICQWTSRLLPCSIINSAAMNIGVHVSFSIMVSSGYVPSSGIMVVLFLVFKEISILFSIVSVSIYISTNRAREFPFLHILSSIFTFHNM